jgi:adenylate cyclase
MPSDEDGAGSPDRPAAELERENRILERRLRRMEANVRRMEEFQDANSTLLTRLLNDLDAERARSARLLLNVLPQRIIDRLNAGEARIADRHDDVTILFLDIVGFTGISSALAPAALVEGLNELFTGFDSICDANGVEKIKTVGDAYLVAGGLARPADDHDHARDTRLVAETAAGMAALASDHGSWQVRIGIHAGPVVAGVVGSSKFAYDVWGDTVNLASRLQSSAEPGRIQVSSIVASRLAGVFDFEPRGSVELKGKGEVETFYLGGRRA